MSNARLSLQHAPDSAGTSNGINDCVILKKIAGITDDEALKRNAHKMVWKGVLTTVVILLGLLQDVPYAGFAFKAISMISAAIDGVKRHRKQMKRLLNRLQVLKGNLERLHGQLRNDEALLKRIAAVVLGGVVVVHAINKPMCGPRALLR